MRPCPGVVTGGVALTLRGLLQPTVVTSELDRLLAPYTPVEPAAVFCETTAAWQDKLLRHWKRFGLGLGLGGRTREHRHVEP
jgi:hypothetical protein